MRSFLTLLVIIFTIFNFQEGVRAEEDLRTPEVNEWAEQAARRCGASDHPVVEASDFGWGLQFSQMPALMEKMYNSPKRLQHRFYYEAGRGFLGESQGSEQPISVPQRFLYSIKRHIESALRLGYAQWVLFPDMGHNHYFIDQQTVEKAKDLGTKERIELYLRSPQTKILYHTLEQIEVKGRETGLSSDTWAQWRYYTRNIVGDNQGRGILEVFKNFVDNYNTVREPPEGYHYYGAGVNISANKNGCFSYEHQGETYYFDVSFYDLPYNP